MGTGSCFYTDGLSNKGVCGGGNKAENVIPSQCWLWRDLSRVCQEAAGARCLLLIYRPAVVSAAHPLKQGSCVCMEAEVEERMFKCTCVS